MPPHICNKLNWNVMHRLESLAVEDGKITTKYAWAYALALVDIGIINENEMGVIINEAVYRSSKKLESEVM